MKSYKNFAESLNITINFVPFKNFNLAIDQLFKNKIDCHLEKFPYLLVEKSNFFVMMKSIKYVLIVPLISNKFFEGFLDILYFVLTLWRILTIIYGSAYFFKFSNIDWSIENIYKIMLGICCNNNPRGSLRLNQVDKNSIFRFNVSGN